MQQDTEYTEVIFRRWPKSQGGDVLALFPLVPWSKPGECASYAHVGQHGGASLAGCIERTRPARTSEPDVRDLHAELERAGYRLRVLHRSPPWRKVRDAYNALEAAMRSATL